ncbi:hypothetical protein [Stenotrophomonas sp. PS02300]|uniref:hypothetical protein n=1 Tax=Stenotrophomonas sp. PS02300 TaxID=2991426 RepID=UPI00249B8E2B|nr:hypothetical protein [Stenotrophomonas sp. PS02300]
MPISPEHLRDFARRHACGQSDEVALRAASSRSYYAAFHFLHPFVDQLPSSRRCPPNVMHVSHAEMIERLREWRTDRLGVDLGCLVPLKSKLIVRLIAARNARVRADYQMNADVSLGEVKDQICRVRDIVDAVVKINNEIIRLKRSANPPTN